jgi:hypothetical protein
MRERTTWNRDMIRQAASNKTADPYTMNQDHVNQQPKADGYVTGTPSDFAEDVNKENRWETEYSGGAVKRDEIGMPEKRPETYNHPEKTASEAVLLKKAELTVKVARMMLPKSASEDMVTDQAYALMYMPDAELINTFDRLANEGEFPGGQFPTAQGQPQQVAQPQGQQPVAEQGLEAMVQSLVQQALKQQACGQTGCQKQAAEDEKKQAEQDEKKQAEQDEKKQQEAKQASQPQISSDQIAQLVQQAVQQALAQQGQPAPQQAQIQPPAQVEPTAGQDDTAMLDAMLMDVDQAPIMDDMGIEMETPMMDTGDVVLGPEDDVLRTLFANQETEDAEKAQQAQEGGQQDQGQKQGMTRTASTRTVGTRPTQGVSRVGGAAAPAAANGGEVNKLAALWPSAPDVREAFGISK